MRGRLVHPGCLSDAPCGLLGSSVVVGFTRECTVGRWVHLWWHSGAPWGSLSSSRVVGFTRVLPSDIWVHPGSFGSFWSSFGALGSCGWLGSSEVVGYTRLRLGGRGSSCAVGFTRVRAACLRVHPGWLRSLWRALEVAGFIRDHSLHSCTPWVLLGSSVVALGYALVVVGFIWGRGVHSGAP